MYQLFIFFMVTDPKTTVRTKTGQCVVVFLVALVERDYPDDIHPIFRKSSLDLVAETLIVGRIVEDSHPVYEAITLEGDFGVNMH